MKKIRDSELIKKGENDVTMYLCNEFNSLSGRHISLYVMCTDKNKYSK